MKFQKLAFILFLCMTKFAYGQSRIVCEPDPKAEDPITSIWPAPYFSEKGALCFDVKGWSEYSGQNCVKNGGRISWNGLVIVSMDGESQGRDSTSFRIINPVINDERIEYVMEWTRSSTWQTMQNVKINRLSGEAVSYFVTMHGGDSYQCHLERRKL